MLRAATSGQYAQQQSASSSVLPAEKDGSNALPPHAPSDAPASRVLYEDDEAREAMQLNETYLWLLALAAAAECITTCFVPDWGVLGASKINVSATVLNFIGPFLDGVSYGYEDLPKTQAPSIACRQFRSAFLGVFTSYSFMVDHAGDLSTRSFFMGPVYICTTVAIACASFHLGRRVVRPMMKSRTVSSISIGKVKAWIRANPSLLSCVTVFVLATTLTAAFGPKGFVRDPKDPQFIGALRVADGEELFLGIFMSCSAILISDYICDHLKPRVMRDALGNNVSIVDWGCLLCNFLSCFLVCLAYEASKLSPNAIQHNLLVLKFVSSFCGSLSCFSAAISHITRLWQSDDKHGALWNLLLHLVVGLLFIPYLNKQEEPSVAT
uniref:Transmembrane protein n=1 Tax=Globisporangium ultimum (strain ATCC 200006 / CBS 805.95 / DAOM BR144) TaxID=431595 RepID=K3W7P9_GLOUD